MRKVIIVIILLLSSLSFVGCEQKPKIVDVEGKVIDFSAYRGKWVAVNYWASWCNHCLQELPALNQLYKKHKDRLLVFGVNFDHLPVEQLQTLATKFGIQFPVLASDPAQVLGLGRIDVIPVTYVIDPKGKVSKPIIGETAVQQLEKIITNQPQ